MVSGQEALGNAILEILANMVVIASKDESTAILEVDLHPNQAFGVSRKVMKLDPLAEIDTPLVKDFPVEIEVEIVLEIYGIVQAGSDAEEGASEFLLVAPDWDLAAFEVAETSGMICVEMAKDDGFDVVDIVASRLDSVNQIVLFLVDHAVEDVVDRAGHLGPVLSTASLVQDQACQRMFDKNTVHGKDTSLVDERNALRALERHIRATNQEGVVCFEIS